MMLPERYLPGSYEELFEQGNTHLQNNEIDEAFAVFNRLHARLSKLSEKSFALRPDLKELKTISAEALGVICHQKKDYERAISIYQELLQDTPPDQHIEWRHAIARLKIDRGEVETGLDELRALAVMNSEQAWPWLSLGQVLLDQDELVEAETNLLRATERHTDDERDMMLAYASLFMLYKKQARYDEAEKVWLKLMKVSDGHAKDVMGLYRMYLNADLLDKAEYWINKEENPLQLGLYRGILAEKRGDAETAQELWQKTYKRDPNKYKIGQDAWAEASLRANQDPNEIAVSLARLIQREKLTPRGAILLAIAEVRAGDLERAHMILKTTMDGLKYDLGIESDLLPPSDWKLFSELVADEETRNAFAQYFELEDV